MPKIWSQKNVLTSVLLLLDATFLSSVVLNNVINKLVAILLLLMLI